MGLQEAVTPEIGPPNKRAAFLLGALALIATVTTALGVASNDLPSLWRNQPVLSYAAVTLILAAIALGAVAGWILKAEKQPERVCLLVGNGLLGLGLVLLAWAALAFAGDRPEPSITATPIVNNGQTQLEVTVENSKLSSGEDLTVSVDPLTKVERLGEERHYNVGRPLFSASYGPNKDGDVNRTITLDVPPGEFDDIGVRAWVDDPTACNDIHASTGCVVVRVPIRKEQPQLSFKWVKAGKAGPRLRVHLTALDIPGRSIQFRAQAAKPRGGLLAQANLAPNLAGDIDANFMLPVKGARVVCVAASTDQPRLRCPPVDRSNPAWARLRVPSQR